MTTSRAVQGIQRESEEIPLWKELREIICPTLLIGGGKAEALLKKEHIELYRENLRDVEVVLFEDSGHNVSVPDFDRYI